MRCFGRARLTAGTMRPFAFSFFRAEDLAAVLLAGLLAVLLMFLRADDFFCAALRLAARAVGFCLAIDVLPFGYEERVAQIACRRVGKGALAPCPPSYAAKYFGGHASLCPPYIFNFNAAGTRRRRRATRRA